MTPTHKALLETARTLERLTGVSREPDSNTTLAGSASRIEYVADNAVNVSDIYQDIVGATEELAVVEGYIATAAEQFEKTQRILTGNPVIIGGDVYSSPAEVGEHPLVQYCPHTGFVSQIVTRSKGNSTGNYDLTIIINDIPVWGPTTITPTTDRVIPMPGIDTEVGDEIVALFDNFVGTVNAIALTVFVQPTTEGTIPGISGDITTNTDLTMATDKLLGRDTAGNGAVEQLGLGAGLAISGGNVVLTAGAAWADIDEKDTTSGTEVVFTNIPSTYGELYFDLENVSHNSGTNQHFYIQFSSDNGATWTAAANITNNTQGGSGGVDGGVHMPCVTAARPIWTAAITTLASPPTGSTTSILNGRVIELAERLNAVKFTANGAGVDAGKIYLRGR